MKYSVIILTGLLSFGFLGCSMQKVQTQKSKSLVKKSKVKKSSSKIRKSPSKVKNPQKKIINDYKSTIYKNVAKSKDKKKKLALLEAKREKLLHEMQLLQASYAKSKDTTLLNKKRAKITKELNDIEKEYEALKSKVVVVNYTEKKSNKKD